MVVAPDTLLDSSYKMRAYMTYKKIGSNELTTIYSINGIVKINDTNEFKALATATAEELSKTYILTQNIEFPTEGAGRWFAVPIGNTTTPFTGTFDGQGFTIAGFQGGEHTVENFGIFGVIGKTGVVKNLGLVGRSEHTVNLGVTNDFYWGKNSAIVASVNKGLIENLYVQVRLMSPESLVSGLVSDNQGTVRYVVSRSRAFKEDPYEPYAAFALTNTGTVSNVFVDADYTEATTFLPGHPELNSNLLVAAFYQAATYASFDPTIWLIQEDEIPALKPQITP